MAITIAAYVAIAAHDAGLARNQVTWLDDLAVFGPKVHDGEWWRLVTNSVVHYSVIHIAFNMYALYLVGNALEPATGPVRFALLYVVSVLGGAFGALLLDPNTFTGGASGGVFGIAAAATLAMQRRGVRFMDTQFGPILLINLFLTFFLPGISIGGHLGGMAAGLLATEAMLQSRKFEKPQLGVLAAALVGVAAIIGSLLAASQ
jgi:membrane associated rhomboid family serine protease